MSNELALAIDFYMWLAVVIVFSIFVSILVGENIKLRAKVMRLTAELNEGDKAENE